MIKIIIIGIIITIILILCNKLNLFEKINKILKDYINVRKYKKLANTFEIKYNSRNEDYINSLETIQLQVIKIEDYKNQVLKLKQEIKELKLKNEKR